MNPTFIPTIKPPNIYARTSLTSMNCPILYFNSTIEFPLESNEHEFLKFEQKGGLNGYKIEISYVKWKWVSILFFIVFYLILSTGISKII